MSDHNNPAPKRGFKPNSGNAAESFAKRLAKRSSAGFSYRDLPDGTIDDLVRCVTSGGDGLLLGRTSDGGALAITILSGDERLRDYPATLDDWHSLLEWAHNAYGM